MLKQYRTRVWQYVCPHCEEECTASVEVPLWPIGVKYYVSPILCECGEQLIALVDLGEKRKG
jgi:phage terminase large subunit GpA-like protein